MQFIHNNLFQKHQQEKQTDQIDTNNILTSSSNATNKFTHITTEIRYHVTKYSWDHLQNKRIKNILHHMGRLKTGFLPVCVAHIGM